MDHYDYDPGRSFDRRIGHRSETDAIEVSWVLPASGLIRNERVYPGRIEQVSLTGAAVIGPAGMRAKVGDMVLLRYLGTDSSVIVRRRDVTGDPTVRRYGVELVVVHPTLQVELFPGQRSAAPPLAATAPARVDAVPDRRPSAARPPLGDLWGDELQLPERVVEAAPVVEVAPDSSPVEPHVGTGTSAADADEVRELVDELRRFMED